jgi:hypothetical protein
MGANADFSASSWPGLSRLVPAIHVSGATRKKDVDARHKAGHDESWVGVIDVGKISVGSSVDGT